MARSALEGYDSHLTLKKGDRPSSVTGEVEEKSEVTRELGGAYRKSKASGIFHKDGLSVEATKGKELHLVVKNVGNHFGSGLFGKEDESMSPASRYYERWRFLRDRKIPTVSSMRVVDNDRVAMGDMTVGGAAFFGKEKQISIHLESKRGVTRSLSEIERVFLSLDVEDIKSWVAQLQMLTWVNDIRLPGDDEYDLLVWPDGRFQIVLMDLSDMRRRGSEGLDVLLAQRDVLFEDINMLVADLKKIGGV